MTTHINYNAFTKRSIPHYQKDEKYSLEVISAKQKAGIMIWVYAAHIT